MFTRPSGAYLTARMGVYLAHRRIQVESPVMSGLRVSFCTQLEQTSISDELTVREAAAHLKISKTSFDNALRDQKSD